MKIIVIGDIILDTNHYCNTTRNAPEANIPVYNVINTQHILGGAGNVACNLCNLGCDVIIVSAIGNDFAGSTIETLITDNNLLKHHFIIDNDRKTTQKNRIFCNNKLINRFDIEDTFDISQKYEKYIIQYIKTTPVLDAIIFSDYNKGFLTKSVCKDLIEYANKNNILTFVDPKPKDVLKYKNCFCLKLNLLEGETITGKTSKNEILNDLKTHIECKHVILTCGEHGLYVDSIYHHFSNNIPINVVDVTGCGDTVLVVVSYMYLKTLDIIKSCKIANYIAGKCVSVIGNNKIFPEDINSFLDTLILDTETDKLRKLSSLSNNIVFTNGCFDIIHSAHISLLQFAKKHGDILIVGLNSDASVKRQKGASRPINNIEERCNLLLKLGFIDFIIIFEDDTPLNILSILKPNIIIKGGDYNETNIIGKEYANKIVIFNYLNGISSTNIINKINNTNNT